MTKRVWTRLLDRVGGKLVARIADTSADAPSAYHEPKRDAYKKADATPTPAAHDPDHNHD